MKAMILCFGALLAACSSVNSDGNANGGESVCELGKRTCPDAFARADPALVQQCSPMTVCEVQCLMDNGCVFDRATDDCAVRCASNLADAGTPDTALPCHTDADCPSWARSCSAGRCVAAGVTDSGTPPPPEDTGSGGVDTSTGGGGAGCTTVYDDYSCTCIAGTFDDGKGCSTHTLAAPAGCCSTSSRCACDAVTCTSSGSGCICMLGGYGPTDTSCSGTLCCAFEATADVPGNCQCYDKPGTGGCAALGGTTVSSCSASTTPCYDPDERSISSCE